MIFGGSGKFASREGLNFSKWKSHLYDSTWAHRTFYICLISTGMIGARKSTSTVLYYLKTALIAFLLF